MKSGVLYLCATPIGNLSDITLRCIETLKEVDLIAAEDTRKTIKLLNHFGIKAPMTSYFEHNRLAKGGMLIDMLKEGKNIALVSDAGTPAISDPGEDLVKLCIENGIKVSSIPGASACISALIMSGLTTGRFCFEGFLSVNKMSRKNHLEAIINEKRTMIFYEAPHKLRRTLRDLYKTLGERKISIARELTKIYEEVVYTTLSEAAKMYLEKEPIGEYVLVIEGAQNEDSEVDYSGISITEHVQGYMDDGLSEMDAIKATAKDRRVAKNEVYKVVKKK